MLLCMELREMTQFAPSYKRLATRNAGQMPLSQDHHLFHLRKPLRWIGRTRRLDAVEIDAGCHRDAVTVPAIPNLGITARSVYPIQKRLYFLPEDVIDPDRYMRSDGQIESDRRRGVERIRVILIECELPGYLAPRSIVLHRGKESDPHR